MIFGVEPDRRTRRLRDRARVRHARRAGRARHGAHLPGQPHPQLRPGRARAGADGRSPLGLIVFGGLQLLPRPGHRPRLARRPARRASSSSSSSAGSSKAPRLILTVATIGLSAAAGRRRRSFIPAHLGRAPDEPARSHVPFDVRFAIDPIMFSADHLVALVVAPLVLVGVAVFLALHQHRHRHPGQRPSGPTGPRCSASRSSGSRRWCGRVAALLSFIGRVPPGRHHRPAGRPRGFGDLDGAARARSPR